MPKESRALEDLFNSLNAILERRGFRRDTDFAWHRQFEWKVDVVDVDVKRGLKPAVLPSLRIIIPSTGLVGTKEWAFQYLTYDNVPRILGLPNNYRIVPTLFRKKFVKTIASEVEKALPWFDQYGSPDKCLAQLDDLFDRESIAFKDAERHLRAFCC